MSETTDMAAPPAWGWLQVGAVLVLTMAGTLPIMLLLRLVPALTGMELDTAGMASPVVYVAGASIYGILLLGIYLFAARRAGWSALGWRSPSVQDLFITTPLLLLLALSGMMLINLVITAWSGQFENPQVEAITGGESLATWQVGLLLLLLAGVVPIAEELLFRGMIYPLLRYRGGAVVAIVASAALFSLVHVFPPLLPALFFVGLVLGLLREWSKSVIPGIVLHAAQNSLALLAIASNV